MTDHLPEVCLISGLCLGIVIGFICGLWYATREEREWDPLLRDCGVLPEESLGEQAERLARED